MVRRSFAAASLVLMLVPRRSAWALVRPALLPGAAASGARGGTVATMAAMRGAVDHGHHHLHSRRRRRPAVALARPFSTGRETRRPPYPGGGLSAQAGADADGQPLANAEAVGGGGGGRHGAGDVDVDVDVEVGVDADEYEEVEMTAAEYAELEKNLDAQFRSYDAPPSSSSAAASAAPNTTMVDFELYEEVDTLERFDLSPAKEPVHVPRDAFSREAALKAIRLPLSGCSTAVKKLGPHLLNRRDIKRVVQDPTNPDVRLVLLSEEASAAPELPDSVRAFIEEMGGGGGGGTGGDAGAGNGDLAGGAGVWQIVPYVLHLDWNDVTASEVLQELLPPGVDVPSAFESVGHVAHVNLRKEHEPYKRLIGQVLLEKNAPRIRTVVNKVRARSPP